MWKQIQNLWPLAEVIYGWKFYFKVGSFELNLEHMLHIQLHFDAIFVIFHAKFSLFHLFSRARSRRKARFCFIEIDSVGNCGQSCLPAAHGRAARHFSEAQFPCESLAPCEHRVQLWDMQHFSLRVAWMHRCLLVIC